MLIPRHFINELLARCDIVELIKVYVPLREKGNNHVACCPFHNEKTPSFSVNATKQFYHCFGCGVSGNAIGFLIDYEHLTFVEAVETIAAQLGMTVPREAGHSVPTTPHFDLYQLMQQAANYYQQQLRQSPLAIDYLKQRGLSGQIAKQFGIGYASSAWDGLLQHLGKTNELISQLMDVGLLIKKNNRYYDRFRDRIMFPIRDKRGRIIAFGGRIIKNGEPKYLNSPETSIFHKSNELYGLYEAQQSTRNLANLIVVEGYMDAVTLVQHTIVNVVATLGTATSPEHIKRLFHATNEVIFCFDGDKAGQTAAWRALEVALPLLQDDWQLRFLLLPEGEDPDSLMRKEGHEQFKQRLEKGCSCADFLFTQLTRNKDLGNLEGRASLAKKASVFLNKMSAPVLQHMLFERLANLVRMDVGILKNITKTQDSPLFTSPLVQKSVLTRSPMRQAIALLLQNPQLVQSLPVSMTLEELTLPGSHLLFELIELLRENPNLNTGSLLEYWRDRTEYRQLMQLASMKISIPPAGNLDELLGIIQHLQQLGHQGQIETLLQKARQNTLTEIEKQHLQELITIDKTRFEDSL